ncbi:ladderlectin-like [Penaeus japonicus]|uniref:ladderlectin-like n=1 Tax=Penaeus japonicus TaxID=27405 RepID=UPI001C71195A|nr:ladderlectin-like [Penaeus japonicus]
MMTWSLPLFLLATLTASGALQEPESLQHELFPPPHQNCTQSLTDYLLLRQEVQLSKMVTAEEATTQLMKENLQMLTQVSETLTQLNQKVQENKQTEKRRECSPPFSSVGDSCLLLTLREKQDWASARQFCLRMGADLAHFSDAAGYVDILKYVNEINAHDEMTDIWLGGTDEAQEGTWLWVTGEPMPEGPPFWGSRNDYESAPDGGRSQNCAGMYKRDRYYVHDLRCNGSAAPLCQK